MWRSLVAHLTGGQGVAGSNPVIPTVKEQVRGPHRFGGAGLCATSAWSDVRRRFCGQTAIALDGGNLGSGSRLTPAAVLGVG